MKRCPFCAEEIQDAAIVCKHCGRDLPSAERPAVPEAAPPFPTQEPNKKIGCGGLLAWGILGGIGLSVIALLLPQDPEAARREQRARALVICQEFVKDRLRSPASAKFGGLSESTANEVSGGEWLVRSHVDSQNGFGAMLRSEYTCTIKPTDGQRWQLVDLKIDGK